MRYKQRGAPQIHSTPLHPPSLDPDKSFKPSNQRTNHPLLLSTSPFQESKTTNTPYTPRTPASLSGATSAPHVKTRRYRTLTSKQTNARSEGRGERRSEAREKRPKPSPPAQPHPHPYRKKKKHGSKQTTTGSKQRRRQLYLECSCLSYASVVVALQLLCWFDAHISLTLNS